MNLHEAARNGDLDMVQELLASGTMIDGINEIHNTPLHVASKSGHLAVMKFLLDKGAAVNAADSERWSPLHFASNNGHLDVVKYLLDNGAAVDTKSYFGETPLILACSKGHLSVVKCLVENGAAVDMESNRCWTPLHMASENGHMDIVKYLLEKGAAVDKNDQYGHTPLELASAHPHLDVVKYLLDNGATIDTTGNLCWKLLLAASEKGRLDIVKYLFNKGAAVDINSGYFGTPLESAYKNGHLNVVMFLIDKGITFDISTDTVEMISRTGEYPLNWAYKHGHFNVFNYLLDKGAKVDRTDDGGQTLLHLASMYGDLDATKSLLKKGAKVDARDHVGQRPLHLASINGHECIVRYLIDKGAATASRDNYGWTSFHYAFNFGNEQVVLALLDAGVDTTLTTKGGETVQDLSSDGKLLALLDKLDWIRKCFGKDMVPNLAKNPRTVSFLADSALYATMRSIQQNPYKFIKHQNDARVLTAFNELSKLTSPHSVHTSSTYYDQLTIKDSSSTSGVYSTQSAIEYIQHTVQNIKNMDSDLLHSAKAILSLVLEFQTNRERLLATGVMVGRIVNRMTWRGAPMQDSNLLQIVEDVRIYLQSKLQTTQAWKLLLYNNHRQATIQAIDTKIIRFQDKLCQAANYLNLDLKLQVVGNVNECAVGFERMIDTINGLDKYLELISNVPSLREQTDKLQELIIQMKRGFEHYSRQLEVGNIARNVEFESQVKKCQNQIEDTVKDMSQKNKSRYCIEKIESWMLSSDDIEFDPDNFNSALGRGGFATVYRGIFT
ncbi:hypothetical protein AeRB84_006677 [Aphanomyces euteiches]|nr:hypothetical protein AeRB84_006677 [Aphanomyces euteiches]